jgi:hypothetical protein
MTNQIMWNITACHGRKPWDITLTAFERIMSTKNFLGKHKTGWRLFWDLHMSEAITVKQIGDQVKAGHITYLQHGKIYRRVIRILWKKVTSKCLPARRDGRELTGWRAELKRAILCWRAAWNEFINAELKQAAYILYKDQIISEHMAEQKAAMDKTFARATTRDGCQMPNEVQDLIEEFVGHGRVRPFIVHNNILHF